MLFPDIVPVALMNENPTPQRNISGVVESIERAAQMLSEMTTRIEQLEAHYNTLVTANTRLEDLLAKAYQAIRAAEARQQSETGRAERLEGVAAHQTARVLELERELSAMETDLAHVAGVVTEAFR